MKIAAHARIPNLQDNDVLAGVRDRPCTRINLPIDVEAYPRCLVIGIGEMEDVFERVIGCGDEWVPPGFLNRENVKVCSPGVLEQTGEGRRL